MRTKHPYWFCYNCQLLLLLQTMNCCWLICGPMGTEEIMYGVTQCTPCIVFLLRWLLLVHVRVLSCEVPCSFLTSSFQTTPYVKKWPAHSALFWFLCVTLKDLCVLLQDQDLGEGEPFSTAQSTGCESHLVPRGTRKTTLTLLKGQTHLNSVVVGCNPIGLLCFWLSRKK